MENTEQNLFNNNRKLSEKETIKLVELYGENECLWNFRNKDYKNKNKRNECYEVIKNELNLESVAVVKKKIKSIRDTYNAEKAKVKTSHKSGAGTDDVYHSKLVWYNTMAGFLTQSEGRSSYKTLTGEREKDDSSTGNYINRDSSCEIPHVEKKIEIPPQPYKKRKMKTDTSENIFTAIDQLRQLKNETTQDEYYYFGQSIASQLRAMPDKICAAETQLEIQNLLTKNKIENLKKNTFKDQRCSSPLSSYNSSTTDSPNNILEEAVNMIFDENEEELI